MGIQCFTCTHTRGRFYLWPHGYSLQNKGLFWSSQVGESLPIPMTHMGFRNLCHSLTLIVNAANITQKQSPLTSQLINLFNIPETHWKWCSGITSACFISYTLFFKVNPPQISLWVDTSRNKWMSNPTHLYKYPYSSPPMVLTQIWRG